MAGDVLKEYLVGLGFKIDDTSYNKWTSAIAKTTKQVAEFGGVVTGGLFAIEKSVERTAISFERLYYTAQRNNSSIASIKNLQYATSQIGLSAATGANAIEHLGMLLRTNPGTEGWINALGVRTRDVNLNLRDTTKLIPDLIDSLKKKYPYAIATQIGQDLLGVDDAAFKTLWDNNDETKRQRADRARRADAAGLGKDAEKALGDQSLEFMKTLRQLESEFGLIGDQVNRSFIGPMTSALKVVESVTEWAAKMNNEWHGLPGEIIATFTAFKGASVAVKLLGLSLGKLGLGSVAAEGAAAKAAVAEIGGAAAAATPAVGTLAGLLGALTLPLATLAAAFESFKYIHDHTAEIRTSFGLSPTAGNTRGGTQRGGVNGGTKGGANGGPKGGGHFSVEDYIKQSAIAHGIDPAIALAVAKSEGLNNYVGDRGSSYGPYQLHYGGVAKGGMAVSGLGDEFTKETGLDARDRGTIKQQIDFALGRAAKSGWGAWHGWKGDKFAGIGGRSPFGNTALGSAPSYGNTTSGDTNHSVTVHAEINVSGAGDPTAVAILTLSTIKDLTWDYGGATRNVQPGAI